MNMHIVVGEVVRNARASGKEKALEFTIATKKEIRKNEETKTYTDYIQAIMFDPNPELVELLTTEGVGKLLGFYGRVHEFIYESSSKKVYRSKTIVQPGTLWLH